MKGGKLIQFNVWPVVQRELREGARRPINYRLRFFSAVLGTLLLWLTIANSNKSAGQLGGWLFASLHTLLLGLIFLIAPALTADCLAREKREGTLGLLFLTPLSAGGIVAGKALAMALRAFTFWLAVLPILTIPFMTGGITLIDAFTAMSLEFCAMALCLAAGLFASSLARERNTAFFLAFIFGAIFLLLSGLLFQLVLLVTWQGFNSLKHMRWDEFLEMMSLFSGLLDIRGLAGWNSLTMVAPVLGRIWMWLCLVSPPIALLIFYAVARFTSWRVERSWQDKVLSVWRESLLQQYCTPLFRGRFRRKMQRTLDWNPIAWLQQYSWKARLGKWSLCLAFLLIECMAFYAGMDNVVNGPLLLLLILAGICTFVGVSGFLEEKRSGALELLLVSPISVNKLIFGRVWGLWKQFLPAGLIVAAAYAGRLMKNRFDVTFHFDEVLQVPFVLACAFLTLPVFATYFALRVKNLIVAAVLTWIAMCLPALLAAEVTHIFMDSNRASLDFVPQIVLLSYGAFALLASFMLRHSLSRRIYSF